jgi:hypothetical protein
MSEAKRGLARIELPARPIQVENPVGQGRGEVTADEEPGLTSRLLMSRAPGQVRDPWIVPLAGLLLAFSAVSLIVELLIAFS